MAEELLHLLAFVAKRSREGCFSKKRSERDKALSDICYWTADYYRRDFTPNPPDPKVIWCGERP